ncbi:MAG: DUF3798 domain-containing protein [Oscillospiraceae bacterium]|nr:DUF3798 domain-containing protein [Oscillospiraceae bacterium]
MLKKLVCLLLVVLMIVPVFAGCRGAENVADTVEDAVEEAAQDVVEEVEDADATEDAEEATDAADGDWIIGIVTGTVSQGEEEFQAGQKMLNRHGAGRIITVTYPDRFNDEIETTIAQVVSLADQGAQAIVFCQAVPGTIASIQRVREQFPDVLFVVGTIMEPPRDIAEAADVVLQLDDIGVGSVLMDQAYALGAEVFIHYSFPRHLGVEMIAARRALLMENAERLGIEFIDVMAPDPTGDAGPAGAQQFILEDVPRQVEAHGVNTAFFSTNCVMQEPLIRSVMELGAIYPQPCCPSPYHAFPAALNISIPTGYEGDVQFMLDQISTQVAAADMSGRISNWAVPVNMLIIEAGVAYAIEYLEGRTNGRVDHDAVLAALDTVATEYGTSVSVSNFADDRGTVDNLFLLLGAFYNF